MNNHFERWNSVQYFKTVFMSFATVYVETSCDRAVFYLWFSKCTFNNLGFAIFRLGQLKNFAWQIDENSL